MKKETIIITVFIILIIILSFITGKYINEIKVNTALGVEVMKLKEVENKVKELEKPLIQLNNEKLNRDTLRAYNSTDEEEKESLLEKINKINLDILKRNEEIYQSEVKTRCLRKASYEQVNCNDEEILKDFS